MRIKKKVYFLLITILLLSFALTGCYDLGDGTESDEEYCEAYAEIRVVDGNSSVDTYSMEDFYNKEAVNDFKSPMDEDDRSRYSFISIKVDKDLSIGNVAVFFDADTEDTLCLTYFILNEDDVPSKVYLGEGGPYDIDESNEPNDSSAVGKSSVKLSGGIGKWDSAVLTSWGLGDEVTKRRDVDSGQFIVIRIDNNCYDRTKLALDEATKIRDQAYELYNLRLEAYQDIINNSSSSQAERNSAMNALNQANEEKEIADRDYSEAQREYEKNKFPYGKMSIRMTAILINAEVKE